MRLGDTVEVVDASGRRLAKAAWSPQSKIRARVWTFNPDETIDDVVEILKANERVKQGDIIVNTGSMPLHRRHRTNMLKITVVE